MAQWAVKGDEEALEYLSLQESEVNCLYLNVGDPVRELQLLRPCPCSCHAITTPRNAQNIALCSPEFDVDSEAPL